MTDITIIGSGNMARAIGTRAVAAGRSLQILDRDQAKAQALAADLGAGVTAGTLGQIPSGAIVVLALYFDAAVEVATRFGSGFAGKTVIDISNPIDMSTFDSLVVAPGTSAAEELKTLLPGSTLVKAFNTTFAGTLTAGSVSGEPLDVFIASDVPEASASVAAFVSDAGLRPIDVGPLRRARELEGFQLLIMSLQVNPAHESFNWNTAVKVLV